MTLEPVLLRKWGNILKRLESVAREMRSGYATISLVILIGPDGEPKFWTEPTLKKLEPKSARVSDLLMELAGLPQIFLTDLEESESVDAE